MVAPYFFFYLTTSKILSLSISWTFLDAMLQCFCAIFQVSDQFILCAILGYVSFVF